MTSLREIIEIAPSVERLTKTAMREAKEFAFKLQPEEPPKAKASVNIARLDFSARPHQRHRHQRPHKDDKTTLADIKGLPHMVRWLNVYWQIRLHFARPLFKDICMASCGLMILPRREFYSLTHGNSCEEWLYLPSIRLIFQ